MFDNGYIKGGQYYFYLRDHLGNNMKVVNANGGVVQQTYYFPFGKPIMNESYGSASPYKFGDKEQESLIGLTQFDFDARQLDYIFGRFTQPDPLAEARPWHSPYSYGSNNLSFG
jgi:RHS repeat-associated protein